MKGRRHSQNGILSDAEEATPANDNSDVGVGKETKALAKEDHISSKGVKVSQRGSEAIITIC